LVFGSIGKWTGGYPKERKAVLLIGGDKKGKNEERFYRNLIKQAEGIYQQYLDAKDRR
jgi:hypothetical protein